MEGLVYRVYSLFCRFVLFIYLVRCLVLFRGWLLDRSNLSIFRKRLCWVRYRTLVCSFFFVREFRIRLIFWVGKRDFYGYDCCLVYLI